MDRTPKGLLDLPDELLDLAFRFLDVTDWKQLQLTCKKCATFAAKVCIQTRQFTLSAEGIDDLIKISTSGHSRFVRTLVYVPIPAWPECSEYEIFCQHFSDPDRQCRHADGIDEINHEGPTAYEEDHEHKKTFKEYHAEFERTQERIRSLASFPYFLQEQQDRQSLLQQFDKTIGSFVALQEFIQGTSIQYDRWWRHLYLERDSHPDEDAEALHLCLMLRSLGSARVSSLRYMRFSVRGPAFWTANRLGWLLSNGDHKYLRAKRAQSDVSVLETEERMAAEEAETDDSGVIAQKRRTLINEVDNIFESVRHVLYLDCTVSEDSIQGGLFSIAEPLSELLERAARLRRLRLAFGTMIAETLRPGFHCTVGSVKLLTLLAQKRPWPHLRRLKLAIVIEEQTLLDFLDSIRLSLVRLTLQCVTLAPGKGTWESTLARMARMLPCVYLKLQYLDDFAVLEGDAQLRTLYQEAAVFKKGDTSYSNYRHSSNESIQCRN